MLHQQGSSSALCQTPENAMGPKTETSAELRPDDDSPSGMESWRSGGPSLQSLELGAVCERSVSGGWRHLQPECGNQLLKLSEAVGRHGNSGRPSGLRQHGQRQGEEADQSKQPQKALQQITGPFTGLLSKEQINEDLSLQRE
ncbi:hypothetical protein NQZ68_006184 [Dissostichus eleginoides]|nr:hypothetical protein NQZ68_006184 [Dissostichus eleginoides]